MIRDATAADLAAITALYGHEVLTGTATFEETPPTGAEMAARLEAVRARGLPWVVAEVDGAFAGNAALVESEFTKAMVAGTYPGVIISAAQRQAAWLHKSALAIADGTPASAVLEGGFPRLHFSRKPMVEIALRNFTPPRLVTIIDQLATAALDMRKQASLAAVIGQRAALDRGEREAAGIAGTSQPPSLRGARDKIAKAILR